MKKVALFACDIMDTITSYSTGDELQKNYLKLIENLDCIRKKYEADELLISFLTYDSDVDYLFRYVNQLKPYLTNNKIKLGNQYMRYGCYDGNGNMLFSIDYLDKVDEIAKLISSLRQESEVVWVGYADDHTNHLSILELRDIFGNERPYIYGFVPSKNKDTSINDFVSISNKYGVEGLNECIANYLNSNIITREAKTNTDNHDIISKPSDSKDYLESNEFSIVKNEKIEMIEKFITEIKSRVYHDGYRFHPNKSIERGEIIKLREFEKEICKEKNICNNHSEAMIYDNLYNKLDVLLSIIYQCGYLHKYSFEEVNEVKYNSSMVALNLALSSNPDPRLAKFKIRPRHRFYRLCDFHKEKTPSMVLDEYMSRFTCYACPNYGSIFSYLMEKKGINFPDAVATLAKAFNVPIPLKKGVTEHKDVIEKVHKVLENEGYKKLLILSDLHKT